MQTNTTLLQLLQTNIQIIHRFSQLASRIHHEISSDEDYNTVVETSATKRTSVELWVGIEGTL